MTSEDTDMQRNRPQGDGESDSSMPDAGKKPLRDEKGRLLPGSGSLNPGGKKDGVRKNLKRQERLLSWMDRVARFAERGGDDALEEMRRQNPKEFSSLVLQTLKQHFSREQSSERQCQRCAGMMSLSEAGEIYRNKWENDSKRFADGVKYGFAEAQRIHAANDKWADAGTADIVDVKTIQPELRPPESKGEILPGFDGWQMTLNDARKLSAGCV